MIPAGDLRYTKRACCKKKAARPKNVGISAIFIVFFIQSVKTGIIPESAAQGNGKYRFTAVDPFMGDIGYDCVWIDTEHTYMSFQDVLCHLNAARASHISTLVRLPQKDLTDTKKILEMGLDGILFPMVRSAKELKEVINMTLYPPHGTRGFGPMRAIGYGALDAGEYVRKQSLEMVRLVQIEHVDLIDQLEEAMEIPYVDGFVFGPNDLSGSVGDFLNVFGEKTLSKIQYTAKILKENGKYFGIAGGFGVKDIQTWSSFDIDMLFSGADWCFVYNQGKQTLTTMKEYMERK